MQRKNIKRFAKNIIKKAAGEGVTVSRCCSTINAGNMPLKDAYRIVDEAIRTSPWQSFAEAGFPMLN